MREIWLAVIKDVIAQFGRAPFAMLRAEVRKRLPEDVRDELVECPHELDLDIFDELYPLHTWEWPLFQRATADALGKPVLVNMGDDDHEVFILKENDARADRVLSAAIRLIPRELFEDEDAFAIFFRSLQIWIERYFVSPAKARELAARRIKPKFMDSLPALSNPN